MKKSILYFAILSVFCFSCKKLIEVDTPAQLLTSDKVFTDSTAVLSALTNVYSQYARVLENNLTGNTGLYADELNYTGVNIAQKEFQLSQLTAANSVNLNIWKSLYLVIYQCNDLLEHVQVSGNLDATLVKKVRAEAKFLRAYAYFYLQNLYDHVPLITGTDVNINRIAPQNTPESVYSQMILDLTEAKADLGQSTSNKYRANSWAASAMLAKIYLGQKNWAAAESESNLVINSALFSPLESLDNVFKAGSKESILQFYNQNGFVPSSAGLIPTSNTALPSLPLTQNLYDAFEPSDLRKTNWIGTSTVKSGTLTTIYRYAFKYKNRIANSAIPEYWVAIRLAELYLIRAEARNELGNLADAKTDLNLVRKRAGLNNTPANTQESLRPAIWQEKRLELFLEWGSRFIELKRTGQLQATLSAYKTTWLNTAQSFPIPQNELIYNSNLTQNQGYN